MASSNSSSSLKVAIIPPRPGAPPPPESPVKSASFVGTKSQSGSLRKRGRSTSPSKEQDLRKRQKGIKGAVQRASSRISAALSRESLQIDSASDSERESSPEPDDHEPIPSQGGRDSTASFRPRRSDGSGHLSRLDDPVGTNDLRATPISRSVIWIDRDSSSTFEKPQIVKINRFIPKTLSDLIIKSNDARPVSFYLDTKTIFNASAVIRSHAKERGMTTLRDSRPVALLAVDEPADLLRDLFSLIYTHIEQPAVTSGDDLDALLGIATRFGVAGALHILCSTYLRHLAVHEPLRAYGLACKHNLQSEIAWTARETLRVNLSKADVTHDLASCTPSQIRNLVQMHTRRGAAAHALVGAARSCDEFACPGDHCQGGVAEWWLEVIRQSKSELTSRPNSDLVFSPIFLAGCVRGASALCADCPMHFFGARTQHRLARLKDDIDALPYQV